MDGWKRGEERGKETSEEEQSYGGSAKEETDCGEGSPQNFGDPL